MEVKALESTSPSPKFQIPYSNSQTRMGILRHREGKLRIRQNYLEALHWGDYIAKGTQSLRKGEST